MVEEGETRAYAQWWAMGGAVSGGVVGATFWILAAMVGRLRWRVVFFGLHTVDYLDLSHPGGTIPRPR